MSPRMVFRPLCRLVFGHEPIVEVNEPANKSEYVCERCRAALGDFVTDLRKSGSDSIERPLPVILRAAPQPIGG